MLIQKELWGIITFLMNYLAYAEEMNKTYGSAKGVQNQNRLMQTICQVREGHLDVIPNIFLLAIRKFKEVSAFDVTDILFHGQNNCTRFFRKLEGMSKL